MNQAEIDALIHLLDDPDEAVYEQIESKLIGLGTPIVEDLENAWARVPDSLFQQRVEYILSTIQFDDVKDKMKLWLKTEEKDLIQGACLLAKIQYQEINTAEIKVEINTIAKSIWLELKDSLTFLEKINVFNQIFYQNDRFTGELSELYKLENNFIHEVLARKKGSPLLLGIIYLSVAQKLKIPMFGVNLPLHFALAYCKLPSMRVMVYINPIARGTLFSKREIEDYLKRMKIDERESFYQPIDNRETILVLAKHLKMCYVNQNNEEKVEQLDEVIALF